MYTEGRYGRLSRRYSEASPWSGPTHVLHLTESEDVARYPQNEIATRQPFDCTDQKVQTLMGNGQYAARRSGPSHTAQPNCGVTRLEDDIIQQISGCRGLKKHQLVTTPT